MPKWILLPLMALPLLFLFTPVAQAMSLGTYNCASRCTSSWTWNQTNYGIASTPNAIVKEEVLTDEVNWYHIGNSNGDFIEVGWEFNRGTLCSANGNPWLWWRDNRPNGGGNHIHCINSSNTCCWINDTFAFSISSEGPGTSTSYDIHIKDQTSGTVYCNGTGSPSCISTVDDKSYASMNVYSAITGSGSDGFTTHAINNNVLQYFTASNFFSNVSAGTIVSANPPFMHWSPAPPTSLYKLNICMDATSDCPFY